MRKALLVLVPVSLVALAAHRLTGGECPIACSLGAVASLFDGDGACGESICAAPIEDVAAGAPRGRYVEARTAAVFAGACHFGGQKTTQGREAVCAWSFEGGTSDGTVDGTPLAGIDVVVALAADENLDDGGPRRAVAYVAEDQPAAGREAALALVRERCGAGLGELEVVLVPTIRRSYEGDEHALEVPGVLALEGGLLPDRSCCAMPFDVWYRPLFETEDAVVSTHATFRFDDARLGRTFERVNENNGWCGRFAFALDPS
jgi:hypothetical protein